MTGLFIIDPYDFHLYSKKKNKKKLDYNGTYTNVMLIYEIEHLDQGYSNTNPEILFKN